MSVLIELYPIVALLQLNFEMEYLHDHIVNLFSLRVPAGCSLVEASCRWRSRCLVVQSRPRTKDWNYCLLCKIERNVFGINMFTFICFRRASIISWKFFGPSFSVQILFFTFTNLDNSICLTFYSSNSFIICFLF